MKSNFKRLGLAAAVSAAVTGYTGAVNAQASIDAGNIGDTAIVPYYTVEGSWVTGLHITNTSDRTQVVKLRLRRASDSMDALDFNIIMSPRDVWSGFLSGEDDESIVLSTSDSTCTAPLVADGKFRMPVGPEGEAFNTGATEGYIEIIGMGAPIDENQPIAGDAKHKLNGDLTNDGVPRNCGDVESNFFRNATAVGNGDPTVKGILSNSESVQTNGAGVHTNTYEDGGNFLSVSFFVRDQESGVEFGSRAVHLADAFDGAMMTNQEILTVGELDPYGYFLPDLDGGTPMDPEGTYPSFASSVRPALGVESVINDWAVGTSERLIDTDWVVTLPGQYLMLSQSHYIASLRGEGSCKVNTCDFRDLPVKATISMWDREEEKSTPEEGGLVISPASGTPEVIKFEHEVNVVKWSGDEGEDAGALGSNYDYNVQGPAGIENGWAEISVEAGGSALGGAHTQAVCEVVAASDAPVCDSSIDGTPVPMVGFVAWKRTLPDQPEASYGRIIDHSFTVASSS